jgi:hypothetical protein
MGDNKDTIDVAELLTEYQADHAAVVKDSCTVALDIMKYWYVEPVNIFKLVCIN